MNLLPFSTIRRFAAPGLVSALLFLALTPSTARAEDAYILDVLRAPAPEGQVAVSARLYGAFTEDIRETIASGAPTSFVFTLRLKRERTLIGDKTAAELIVKRMVKFDTLTKEYRCWEKRGADADDLDFEAELAATGPGDSPKNPPVAPPTLFRDPLKFREWMTRLNAVPLTPEEPLEAGEVYYFAVRAEMDAIELVVPFNYVLFFVTLLDFDTDWGFSAPFMASPEERP